MGEERVRAANDRERIADERERIAVQRGSLVPGVGGGFGGESLVRWHREAAERATAAGARDHAAELRDLAERRAKDEGVAHDPLADGRDRTANRRERDANRRERQRDQRDRAALAQAEVPDAAVALIECLLERADQRDQRGEDRDRAAGERDGVSEVAPDDTLRARMNRALAARDRFLNDRDRDEAAADRAELLTALRTLAPNHGTAREG